MADTSQTRSRIQRIPLWYPEDTTQGTPGPSVSRPKIGFACHLDLIFGSLGNPLSTSLRPRHAISVYLTTTMKRISEMDARLVDTEDALRVMMDDLEAQYTTTPDWHLNVDFEGVNLCRGGELCLGQFAGKASRVVYVVDFVTIEPFKVDPRLKSMLESRHVLKVLFDPRCDADALHHLLNVDLVNVLCLQVADDASRRSGGGGRGWFQRVRGMATVLGDLRGIHEADKIELRAVKKEGREMSNELFKQRPLLEALFKYSALDIYFFDEVKIERYDRLRPQWKTRVETISAERVGVWKDENFKGGHPDNAKSPLSKKKK